MRSHENHRGARHRTLILVYITWLTLSLAPAMVAPPERTFQQGQPELQQAMDNMVNREIIFQKRMGRSLKDGSDLHDVNFKTSNLLEEAEKVLKTLPDSKERQWIESFVERMREISKMLEKTAERKSLLNDNSVKGAPVPDGLPAQTTQPAASAVPEINPYQKPISMMSKIQMTSPEISRVLPNVDHSEHQTVTKPAQLQPVSTSKMEETESDELVRELESLHEENTHQVLSENFKMVNEAQTVSTSSPLKNNQAITESETEKLKAKKIKKESETETLKAKLIQEIKEFHLRGGMMPKEVIDILNADSHKITDSAQSQKIKIDEEMKFTESGMKDRQGIIKLDDLNNDDREISMTNVKNMPHYAGQHLQDITFNHTFSDKHPNLVQAFPKHTGSYYFQNFPPTYKVQPYQGYPQNANQNLQKMNLYNQRKYHGQDMLHQPGYIPDPFKRKQSKQYIFYNGRLSPSNYPNYFMRNSYSPYPYVHNWNPQNSTINLPQMMPPYQTNQAKIDTQLSDEMKRELRDGKIIVLSDSVVRTNFKPDNKKKTNQNTTEKQAPEQMDMKNETTTEN